MNKTKQYAKQMNNEHPRAVIYARYSCSGQNEQSIEGQLRDCYAYAKHEGIQIVGEYIDRAITGRTDDRPEFQKMIDSSKCKQFDFVIVWKLDRFARNRYDSAIYKHRLGKNNVRVLSAMENIGQGDESIILEAVLEASAEYFSRDLSKKVKRGMRETVMKGHWTGGITPLGFKVENKHLVIDKNKEFAPRYANMEYYKGASKAEIVEYLNSHGYKTAYGKPFTISSLRTIIGNPKYFGILEYGGETYEGIIPAMLDIKILEGIRARAEMKKRAPSASKAIIQYYLQGKGFCGLCGSTLVGESGRGRNGVYHYYSCSSRKKKHTCAKRNERKDFLEWYIVEQTLLYVLCPERIKYIAKNVVAKYDEEFNSAKLTDLERRISALDRDIDKCINTIMETSVPAVRARMEQKVSELDMQKSNLEIDLSKLRIANEIRYTEADIISWLKSFCHGDIMDENFRRRIIDVFVNSVYLYDEKVVIFYNIKDGKQVSYIDMLDNTDPERKKSYKKDASPSTDERFGFEASWCAREDSNLWPQESES